MIVADASVWVSHLVAADVNHAESRRWLKAAIYNGTQIAAPALLLAEVSGAIARRTGEPDLGHRAVQHILATPGLRLVHGDAELALLSARLAAAARLRGTDALYVAIAYHLHIPLLSWDQEQIQRLLGLVNAHEPVA